MENNDKNSWTFFLTDFVQRKKLNLNSRFRQTLQSVNSQASRLGLLLTLSILVGDCSGRFFAADLPDFGLRILLEHHDTGDNFGEVIRIYEIVPDELVENELRISGDPLEVPEGHVLPQAGVG